MVQTLFCSPVLWRTCSVDIAAGPHQHACDAGRMMVNAVRFRDTVGMHENSHSMVIRWEVLIVQPLMLSAVDVAEVRSSTRVATKKSFAGLERVQSETFSPIRAAQTLRVGPFVDEPETRERVHAFLERQGLVGASHHHEVYLSDPRRIAGWPPKSCGPSCESLFSRTDRDARKSIQQGEAKAIGPSVV